MGNSQCYYSSENHPRFPKVQYSIDSQIHSMLVHYPVNSQQLQVWLFNLNQYKSIYKHKNILHIHKHQVLRDGLCNLHMNVILHFSQHYTANLKQQIIHRSDIGRLYSEEQLWFIILNICECANNIYKFGEKHMIGNIHPYNLLINEFGEIKIIITQRQYSLPEKSTHFQQYRVNSDATAFISPELIGFLNLENYTNYPGFPKCIDKQISQAFTLGMTMLALTTLSTQMMKCYSHNTTYCNHYNLPKNKNRLLNNNISLELQNPIKQPNYDILLNVSYIKMLLDTISIQYSQLLSRVISSLLISNPIDRISIPQLYEILLEPNQSSIHAMNQSWMHSPKSLRILTERSEEDNVSVWQNESKSMKQSQLIKNSYKIYKY